MENGKEKANTMQVLILNIHSIHLDFSEKPEYMDEERWKKTKRIKSEADKKRSCASGYLLWIMCQKMQIIAPSYGYTKKGKPYLQGVENLSFNLSHSGDYAVLAYHQSDEPIGIDIQQVRVLHESMANRILHENEKRQIGSLYEEEEKQRYLNRIWTMKESFVKMTGEGLSHDFRNLCIRFEDGMIETEDGMTGYFMQWEWKKDYILALSTTQKEKIQFEEVK